MVRCVICDMPKSILPPSSLAGINGPRMRVTFPQVFPKAYATGEGYVIHRHEVMCNSCQRWAAKIAKVIA